MAKPEPLARPTVKLTVHEAVADHRLTDLLLGMEEEGVPVELSRSRALDPLALAHEAALASILGVGVGISLDYVVITTERLPQGQPYIARFLGTSREEDRAIGANAARLVKRTPLIELPHATTHQPGRTT